MKFNKDQITQLLSAFFLQANLPDNLPSNIEAIAHSFCLTLISSRLRVRFWINKLFLSTSYYLFCKFCNWRLHQFLIK